jgi:hypothetical protein
VISYDILPFPKVEIIGSNIEKQKVGNINLLQKIPGRGRGCPHCHTGKNFLVLDRSNLLPINQRGVFPMPLHVSQTHLENDFYRDFDIKLERANLSLTAVHRVLDDMGAPEVHEVAPTSVAQRISWLIGQQTKRTEERVQIGGSFDEIPHWRFLAGVPLIYLPIFIWMAPMVLCALLVRTHLWMVGARNLRSFWTDFVPSWVSHRYTRKEQIVSDRFIAKYGSLAKITRSKLFWIFNCKLYCPLSVALLGYVFYLTKVVEQWWCPFGHDKKDTYGDVPIDKSFWHANGDVGLLHPDDRESPNWNEDAC